MKSVKLIIDNKEIVLPIISGTENEHAIDISNLRQETGFITMDPGYGNTGSCLSKITYIDGERGILRYRGYPIEDLSTDVSFSDISYLLIYGTLENDIIQDAPKVDVFKNLSQFSLCLSFIILRIRTEFKAST